MSAETLSTLTPRPGQTLFALNGAAELADLARGSSLGGRIEELRGKCVLLSTSSQLAAALALIQLDGVARRIVLFTPDFPVEHMSAVVATAGVEAVVSDRAASEIGVADTGCFVACSVKITPSATPDRSGSKPTEWILFTSGTSGVPKMVVHSISSLAGAIQRSAGTADEIVWSTFYDIRRYGGLQILLRAVLGGTSLVISDAHEAAPDFLARAGAHGVTNMTGTPSHWRRALMSSFAHRISPRYVRLSGEIADQAILDGLRDCYPAAKIVHAFASTEAGVAFEVHDGRAGFPADDVERPRTDVALKVEDGSLRIRSARTASRYLGDNAPPLLDADGFVDTGDMLQLRDGRYHFSGRRGGIINVGGLKVHPEEVESVINRVPGVRMSLVKSKKNPITGAIVVADVVMTAAPGGSDAAGRADTLKREIIDSCRAALAAHKVPTIIRIVPSLDVTPSGKLVRADA
ncbi:MAG: long-chain fatty acid--CoA ligase [Gemmatimonadales bacterium]